MVKDLRWRFADPTALILAICIPVLIGGLMSLAFGGSGGPTPRAKVLVVDEDEGFVANFIQGAGGGVGGNSLLDLESVDAEEGRARIDRGEATALLIIPEGFSEAMFEEEPTTLTLIKNPSQTILPEIVEETLQMLVEASFYLHRVLGEPIRALADGPEDGGNFFADLRMAAISVQINQRIRALEPLLFPVVLELETEVIRPAGEEDRPDANFGQILLPGVLFMALLFLAQSMSEDLWREKLQGTLGRLVSAPQSVASFLGGKVFAGGILMTGISLSGLLVGVVAFGVVPWSALPLAMVWFGVCGTVMLCYFLLLHSLAGSQRGGNILAMMVLFPLMMIGGSLFPFEWMPPWMRNIGEWTPNGLAVTELKNILLGSWRAQNLFATVLGIGIPALFAFALTARRLSRAFLAK